MARPQDGDVLIRNRADAHYELVNPITLNYVSGPFAELLEAVQAARGLGKSVWQEVTDERGRPLGNPIRIP